MEEDLPPIALNVQRRIARALEARLSTTPEQHGEPLKGTLKGYWKLGVGDYRVVYKIVRAEVRIFGILHRKQIYEDVRLQTIWRPR
mgnify:CR=1 FL=1